jgi:hypothetical protein
MLIQLIVYLQSSNLTLLLLKFYFFPPSWRHQWWTDWCHSHIDGADAIYWCRNNFRYGLFDVHKHAWTCFISCLYFYRFYPGIQIHDQRGFGDLTNRGNMTALECATWCCSYPHCVCFFHTREQLVDAGDCKQGKSCCWLKPTFNSTRLDDFCKPSTDDCLSGVLNFCNWNSSKLVAALLTILQIKCLAPIYNQLSLV